MEPTPNEKFVPLKVQDIIKKQMTKKLSNAEYDQTKSRDLAMELVKEIQAEVKNLDIPRYKLVVQSILGEVSGQGCMIASRCCWDTKTDNYTSFSMKNQSLFCTTMVFGLYLE